MYDVSFASRPRWQTQSRCLFLVKLDPVAAGLPHCLRAVAAVEKYNRVLLDMLNITVKHCNILKPATLLSEEGEGGERNCVAVLDEVCSPCTDLSETPLPNSDLVLFVDGSASRSPSTGQNQVGYAVVTHHEILKSGSLPSHYSAQAVELVAFAETCKLVEGKTITIYTDP